MLTPRPLSPPPPLILIDEGAYMSHRCPCGQRWEQHDATYCTKYCNGQIDSPRLVLRATRRENAR